jgi:transcriptional regulator with XRE-family HTH domain
LYAGARAYLKGARLNRNLTQLAVARRLGVRQHTVTYYERGGTRLSLDLFTRWCEVLGLVPGEVLSAVVASTARQREREK